MADSLVKGISSETGITPVADQGFKQVNANQFAGPFNQSSIEDFAKRMLVPPFEKQVANVVNLEVYPTVVKGSNPYGVQRLPWIFATFKDLAGKNIKDAAESADKSIIWYANPKSVDWKISQRASETKTKSGTVLHVWRDRQRRTDYDDPKITITFQSGNIMPAYSNAVSDSGLKGEPDLPVAPGLENFYRFLQLVDSSKISGGQANLIHILYRSRIFPSLVLTGFFDPQTVVSFTDSADNPFQVNSWSATFTIYSTVPALNNWGELANVFKTEFESGDPFKQASASPKTQDDSAVNAKTLDLIGRTS